MMACYHVCWAHLSVSLAHRDWKYCGPKAAPVSRQLKPPILLIGNVRSGTSMLYRFFDRHPQVKAWYEPRTVWTYAAPGRKHDRFSEEDATDRVSHYIRKRFCQFQRAHGNLRVMEKTPSNVMRIPYVHKIFPESKLLYIVREPLANLSSSELRWTRPIDMNNTIKRLRETPKMQLGYYLWRYAYDLFTVKVLKRKYVSVWGVRYPGIYNDLRRLTVEQVIANQWVACSQRADADLAAINPELVMRIRYEDFVADPVLQFERICEHFGLSMPCELKQFVGKRADPNRQQKWRRLDPKVLQVCLPILKDEMARHSYCVPEDLEALMSS